MDIGLKLRSIRERPWNCIWAVVGAISTVIGFGGFSDEIAQWASWLSWLNGSTGQWIFVIAGVAILIVSVIWLEWPSIHQRIHKSSFEVRAICGDNPMMIFGNLDNFSAKLTVANTGSTVLNKCSLCLLKAMPIRWGRIQSSQNQYPSIIQERGDSFVLMWSDRESDRYGESEQYLDLPPDGNEHFLDILCVRKDCPEIAEFGTLENLDHRLTGIGGNQWWKLVIRVSSASDSPNIKDVELIASYYFDNERNGSPIILDLWKNRGEEILRAERKRHDEEKQKRIRSKAAALEEQLREDEVENKIANKLEVNSQEDQGEESA